MKVNSHHNPTIFTKSKGNIYLNTNIKETTITDEQGNVRPWFAYDQTGLTPELEAKIKNQKELQEFKKSKEHHFKNFKSEKAELIKKMI